VPDQKTEMRHTGPSAHGNAGPSTLAVHEIQCKSILNRCGIEGIDYALNPYTGCSHACVYCYARFMARYTKHQMAWGKFVDAKVNGPEVLEKQSSRLSRGLVSLSTVTDPYQPLEKKYRLTRRSLEILRDRGYPVSILTKSDLVLRDLDILKNFPRDALEVGFSIALLDESVRRTFEPGAPDVSRRLAALRVLHDAGIRTWVFIAPVLPLLTRESLESLLSGLAGAADSLLVDELNIKCGNWQPIEAALMKARPEMLARWREILFQPQRREEYYASIGHEIDRLRRQYGIQER